MKTEYAVGFMHDDHRIALVRKNRPDWQAGLWNGVGGHIEEYDKSPAHAMAREFWEEAGIRTDADDWNLRMTLEGPYATINVFSTFDERVVSVKTMTDEKVDCFWIEDLFDQIRVVPNLYWIIPAVLQGHKYSPFVVEFHGNA